MSTHPQSVADLVRDFLFAHDDESRGEADLVFDHLTVEGSGRGVVQAAPTIRTYPKNLVNAVNPLAYRAQKEISRTLLHDFSGTINGGEMLLVIGKPSSGCTTFLKSLANMTGEFKGTKGHLSYGGRSPQEMARDFPAEITFCAEEDEHFPTLTVAETLRFAIRARFARNASSTKVKHAVNLLAKIIGLDGVLRTRVGNSYVRGASGGERRRVSLAEALATCSGLMCYDNPTSGLDSSIALEFVQMMREFTNQSQCATAMSVYQASDSMVPLFDKVMVINAGHQVFFGSAKDAKHYFEELGFYCPPRTTEPQARQIRPGYHSSQVPRSPEELEKMFRASRYYEPHRKSIDALKTASPSPKRTPDKARYALPLWDQILLCARRQARIHITEYNTWLVEVICIVVQSLVLGTLFRDQQHSTNSFFILGSSLFYSVLVPSLQSMSEFGNSFAQRPLLLKHQRYRLYRPLAYGFGQIVTDVVWKIVAICYNIPLYWLTNFQRTPANFFIWFLTVYIEHLVLSMLFRTIAVMTRSIDRATLPVGIFFNLLVLYTGLYVPPPQAQVWLSWARYLNPMYYAFETVMVNEFASIDYLCSEGDLAARGAGYANIANQVCAVVGSTPGESSLPGRSFLREQYGFEKSHLWRNIGINAALFIFFAFCVGVSSRPQVVSLQCSTRLSHQIYRIRRIRAPQIEKQGVDDDIPPIKAESRPNKTTSKDLLEGNGHVFAWKNVSLKLQVAGEEKRLLENVDGWVKRGELTALMGMSGAGKTTLLNMLAGRLDIGTISGDLFLDGNPLPKAFSRHMGYVQQQDIHLPTQTVREALQMTARLRRPTDIPIHEKDEYVEAIIEMLEMEDFADALIGVPGAGLNLERRKRATIGVELAAKPDILFLDEPSSGLDGQSAVSFIRLLRKLADAGQSVLCTIHQPAAELIMTFDSLLLLFLDVVGAGSRSAATHDWAEVWTQSEARKDRQAQLAEFTATRTQPSSRKEKSESTYATPLYYQLDVVLRRTWLYYWREPDYGASKLFMSMGNSLLNSLTYLQVSNNQGDVYNRVFAIFMALIVGPPLGLQLAPRFTVLRDVFVHREKASLTYNWIVFVLSAIIVELPYAVISGLIYWLLWYYPIGFQYDSSHAGYCFLMYVLFYVFATSLAQLCAAVMPDLGSTFAANGFFFMFCNTFAGTLSPKPVTPSGWRWYYNVSPLFYFGEGSTTNALSGLSLSCKDSEISSFIPPAATTCSDYARDFLDSASGFLINPNSTTSCDYCRYATGDEYYLQYGYEVANKYRDVGALIGFIAFNFTVVIMATYFTRIFKLKRKGD
ncbi:MAG: hypothetical protein M1837_001031 [Sclerophora amabilis]|nr:MAG: hypothetical protein M1837_001031 [Sclerophora amabilis]